MICGYWQSQCIYVAAKLGIADLLANGPRTIDDLAAATQTNAGFLFRVLRALAGVRIFEEGPPKSFRLTPLAELLGEHTAGSARALSIMMGEEHFRVWGRLLEAVRTGQNMFEAELGAPVFDFLSANPEQAAVFDAAMTGINGRETGAVLDACDFSGINTIADIGGGNGSNLIAVLQRHPHLSGILFDLPHVIERARPKIAEAGLSNRCELVAGSFFETAPRGADAYFMRHIIHDWDDARSLTILRQCRHVMTPNAKLLIAESVIPKATLRASPSSSISQCCCSPAAKSGRPTSTASCFRKPASK